MESITSSTERIGSSSVEAAAQLRLHGRNELPTRRRTPAWKRLAAEFVHFFALMLWVAGALACVAGMPQMGVAIFVVVVINGLFAFAQAERAERATERLRSLMPTRVTARRDGVPAVVEGADVAMGDVVLLSPGDRVAADLDLVDAHSVTIDESMLTGESLPVEVQGRPSMGGDVRRHGGGRRRRGRDRGGDPPRRHRDGHGRGSKPPSPLAGELHRVVRTIALVALGVGVAFFGLSLALGTEPRDGFCSPSASPSPWCPRALLPTVTLSLAMGAQRLAARNALVRNLEAVETLGSTTFIPRQPSSRCTSACPATGTMDRPPSSRHLIDGQVLRRVFGVLGPVEAAIELAAFFVALSVAGWRPGESFPSGPPLLAASGAAFTAMVIGQMANAFACRSASRPPWRLGWTTNRMLLGAVAVECVLLLGFLLVPVMAELLDHSFPPPAGLAVAVLAAPALLAVDAADKRCGEGADNRGRRSLASSNR